MAIQKHYREIIARIEAMGAQANLQHHSGHAKLIATCNGVSVQVTVACSPKDHDTVVNQVVRQTKRRLAERGVELA